MNERDAYTLAIFALNTLAHPEASDPADVASVTAQAAEAAEVLAILRDRAPYATEGPVTAAVTLECLKPGDEVLCLGAHAYTPPRRVARALGPIDPGSPVHGVELEPRPGETIRVMLYPDQVRGLRILARIH